MPAAQYPQTTPMPCYGVQENSTSLLDQLTMDYYHQPNTIVDNSSCDFQNVFPTFSEGSIQPFPIFHENMVKLFFCYLYWWWCIYEQSLDGPLSLHELSIRSKYNICTSYRFPDLGVSTIMGKSQ